jgi:hypothetical protein
VIRPVTAHHPGQLGAALRIQVTDGRYLDVRVVLEAEVGRKPANAVAHQADTDPAVGNGLPPRGRIKVIGCSFEPRDDSLRKPGAWEKPQGGTAKTERLHKETAIGLFHGRHLKMLQSLNQEARYHNKGGRLCSHFTAEDAESAENFCNNSPRSPRSPR